MIMMGQGGFIDCHKCPTLVGDIDSEGGCIPAGTVSIGNSVHST